MNKEEIKRLQELAGISPANSYSEYNTENISHIGSERGKYQRDKKIQPGTDEWFKLWFAKPHLTGENPKK